MAEEWAYAAFTTASVAAKGLRAEHTLEGSQVQGLIESASIQVVGLLEKKGHVFKRGICEHTHQRQ